MGGVGRRGSVFLTSGQRTSTTVLLAEAAAGRGMKVRSLAEADALTASAEAAVHWYGGPLAADRIADTLALGLLEPPDDWLAKLPQEFTGRHVELTTLAEAWQTRHPVFAKPPSDKSFPAAVYADGSRLPRTGEGVADTAVLLSDVVTFAVEYRLFVLDGRVAAGSRYAVYGRLDPRRSTGTYESRRYAGSRTDSSPRSGTPSRARSPSTSASSRTPTGAGASGGRRWRPTCRGSRTVTRHGWRECSMSYCGRRGLGGGSLRGTRGS